ncbi:PQQ-binding-like beta-propeller repeat protein [Nonomuraea sp. NPDC049695]|uniref:outer membrane protein assembly factor BamB family protein n=1 Tax=Nonomuraea sp. NPDC049695 TaxID=3154734 RepID=UPI00342DBFC5
MSEPRPGGPGERNGYSSPHRQPFTAANGSTASHRHNPHEPAAPPPGGPPPPPPQPPPRPAIRPRTVALIAGVAAVLLLVGAATAYYVSIGGTPGRGPRATAARPSDWAVPFPDADSTDYTSAMAFASWLNGGTVIRVQKDGILAYDLSTGRRAWGVPAPGAQLCGATQELQQGRGAIAYGSASVCDHLAGLDTATGRIRWRTKIPAERSRLSNDLTVPRVMSTNGLVVTGSGDVLTGYGLADGRRRWKASPPGECRLQDAAAAPGRLAVLLDCSGGGRDELRLLDPETGRTRVRVAVAKLRLMDGLLSAEPIIVHRDVGDRNAFTVFDGDGAKVSAFTTDRIDLLAMNSVAFVRGMLPRRRYAVHGDRLYLATFPQEVPRRLRSRNRALAFDLRTGERVWESSGTHDTILTYIRADGEGLLALETGDWRALAPRLVRLDAATGRASPVAVLPQKYGTEADKAQVFEYDGAVVIVPWTTAGAKNAVTYVDTRGS